MNQTNNLTELHQRLLDQFSEDDLRTLCFRLGIQYEDLSGDNRQAKARELVLYAQRRGRIADLERAIDQLRPPAPTPPPDAPRTPRRFQLSQDDSDELVRLLQDLPELRTESGRVDFLDDIFAGSSRKSDIVGRISVSGGSRAFAVRLITSLTQFGQAEPGQETLGVLINRTLTYIGGGSDADFLRGLFDKYPLHGQPTATRPLDAWYGRETPTAVQERVIGENTLRDVRLLELALTAAKAVVRIGTPNSAGSGFVAGAGLVMTNHHVIRTAEIAQQCQFTFNYQLGMDGLEAPSRMVLPKPNGLFFTDRTLDVTVVELAEMPPDVAPLALARQRVQRDERVNIIQHPGGHYKKISLQNNFVAFANSEVVQYLTSTEPGSSGSPVFNNDFVVVGIHHSGGHMLEPGTANVYLRNEGSSMVAVLDHLRDNAPEIYGRLQLV